MRSYGYSQSIYLDSVILIGYFERKDIGRYSKEIIRRIEQMLKNREIVVKIPLIVLGEFLAKMIEKNMDFQSRDLNKIFRRLNPEFEGATSESYELASELMQKDMYLKPDDALIVAQAILDETAEWLITTDTDLIANRILLEVIKKRKSKLKISEKFHKDRLS